MKKRDIQMMNTALRFKKIVDNTPQEIKDKVVKWMDEQDDEHEPLAYFCDTIRHLVCLPYSIENLHRMARNLGLKEKWFHKNHYDIPINRVEEITAKCKVVRPRQILEIIKTNSISL